MEKIEKLSTPLEISKEETDSLRQKLLDLQKENEQKKKTKESYNADLLNLKPLNLSNEDLLIYKKILEDKLTLNEMNAFRNRIEKEFNKQYEEQHKNPLNSLEKIKEILKDPKMSFISYIVNKYYSQQLKKDNKLSRSKAARNVLIQK